jgi:hypothetical protein
MTKKTHPTYEEMITEAIQENNSKKGTSRQFISKYVNENYKLPENYSTHLSVQLKRLISNGYLDKIKASYILNTKNQKDKEKREPRKKKKSIVEAKPSKVKKQTKTKRQEAVDKARKGKKSN